MSEIWTPGLERRKTEPVTVYDLMAQYQQELDELPDCDDRSAWRPVAMGAMYALDKVIKGMTFEDKQIRVATNLALVNSVEDVAKQYEVQGVGLVGSLYDVNLIKRGAGFTPELSLAMNVESLYDLDNPSSSDLIMTSASAPIGQIRAVELDAA